MSELRETIKVIRNRSSEDIAHNLDVPAGAGSPYADIFVSELVEDYLEIVDDALSTDEDAHPDTWEKEIFIISDLAPANAQLDMWMQFVELEAWRFETEIFVEFDGQNMSEIARSVLTAIAEAILREIHNTLIEAWEEDDLNRKN